VSVPRKLLSDRPIDIIHCGGAEAARRVDEANKLLKEVANMLTGMRRTMLGGSNRSQ
jgi:hypothetical protein